MDKNVYVVIMAGGIGSRFWPFSRNHYPKQFLDVLGTGQTLLQMTLHRFREVCPVENIYIVTNEEYNELVKEQLPELKQDQILLEPHRRNTAPCIAYASYKIKKANSEAIIVVSPADHVIFKENDFIQDIRKCIEGSKGSDKLITLGIKPTRPETGYGYIQYINNDGGDIKKVKTFTEKPQLDLAKKFVESGEFVWNAGIFVWDVNTITKAFEEHEYDIAEIFHEGMQHYYTSSEGDYIRKAYSHSKNISIDYAVMEKASNVYVVLGDFGWSDLGSWASLHEIKDKDGDNNVIEGNVLTYETTNTLIKGPKDRLIVAHGLDGYLISECDNVLLICKINEEAKFREFVNDVKNKKGQEYL
jgi:mannose-1-phosphate guanylyltransferase